MTSRFDLAAAKIQQYHGVHVEYVAVNREYIVEDRSAGHSAREANKLAKKIAHAANTYGVLGGM